MFVRCLLLGSACLVAGAAASLADDWPQWRGPARDDIAGLQAEVRDFDPRRALDGGPDGLDGYRAIASHAARLLAPDGILVLELGHGQLGPVTSIFTPAGLAPVAPRYDLAGIARALVMRVRP